MLSPQELKQSPLFDGISYESYLRMIDCFQAVQKTYRPEDVAYDFARGGAQVGVLERGTASLLRIDEEGVATVLEDLRAGSVFGRSLDFAGGSGAGVDIAPVAFLVVKDGFVRVLPVAVPPASTLDRVIDLAPDIMDKVDKFISKKKEKPEA